MQIIVVYLALQRIIRLSASAALAATPAAPVRRNPGSRGLAGLNASWSASIRRVRPASLFSCADQYRRIRLTILP